jgi:hypothetical protein
MPSQRRQKAAAREASVERCGQSNKKERSFHHQEPSMKHILKSINTTVLLAILFVAILPCSATSIQTLKHNDKKENLIEATPVVFDYVSNVVKPVLDSYDRKDKLSLLLMTNWKN